MRGRRQTAVAVAVSDESDGIPREHLPRLTERFYRVDTARSRDLGGTGLGLAIVKHIMNRHRGALEIDSATGRGSTFAVYLPAASGPTVARP
jgi:two-component system phosphate regulon sensor histidine kinase PhoR